MRNSFLQKFTAFFMVSLVWLSAISFYPVSVAAQTTPNTNEKSQDDKNKPNTNSGKPLSEDEDPSQIGKRNINGSLGNKFFGWLGGSREKEAAIGRQLSLEVEQQAKLVEDPVINEYINRVGQNVVIHSDAKIPFTIKVIDSDEVNAFALPGGFFYVNRGLILAADNEAEIAGVMAHEIAHVAARHAMENAGKGQFIGYGILAGLIFAGPIAGTILQNTAGLGQALAFFNFSRSAEQEADKLGVQYLYAAGYDPTAMSTMFEKLASKNKKKPGTLSKLFSSHPQSIDRRDDSLALVARFPEREEYIISTSEFQRVKEKLLRQTNAKAMTQIDYDGEEDGRPTLKRRQPEPDSTDTTTTPKEDGPPVLKKRGEESSSKPDNR